jgi:inactivated superfamily I helicase
MASDTPTVDAFKAAYMAEVRRLRALTPKERLKSIQVLCKEFDPAGRRSRHDDLKAMARAGSIEAAAHLLVLCDHKAKPDQDAIDAIAWIARRSADIGDELVTQGLVVLLEEYGDEQVAAGKWTVRVGPDGHKLYTVIEEPKA